jgi:hypothetical protein
MLNCPTCKIPFRAHPSTAAPVVFNCGHSVCIECADAMAMCNPALCLVCREPILSRANNCALGSYAEETAMLATEMDADAEMGRASIKRQRHDTDVPQDVASMDAAQTLIPLIGVYAEVSNTLSTAVDGIVATKEQVIGNTFECVHRINATSESLLLVIETWRKRQLADLRDLCDERVKILEAQEDELTVSAGQLSACVALGQAALATGDASELSVAVTSALSCQSLTETRTTPKAASAVDLLCDVKAVVSTLNAVTCLKNFKINGSLCKVSGDGLVSFDVGAAGYNCIRVHCKTDVDCAADWITAADVVLTVTRLGTSESVGYAKRMAVVKAGVVELDYAVDAADVQYVELEVYVAGERIIGGPWRAGKGFQATGVRVSTVKFKTELTDVYSTAVSLDDKYIAVSKRNDNALFTVYSVADGSFVCWCAENVHGNLCTTGNNTLLAREVVSNRVVEYEWTGKLVKSFRLGFTDRHAITSMDCHGQLLAVGLVRDYGDSVFLLDVNSGKTLRQFGREMKYVADIKFTSDGRHLVVLNPLVPGMFAIFSVEGMLVRRIPANVTIATKIFGLTGTDDIIASSKNSLHLWPSYSVYSNADGVRLSSWEHQHDQDGGFNDRNWAVSGRFLYVLDEAGLVVYK